MAKKIVTVVREDGSEDYFYEETVKYAPPPYEVEKVGLTETYHTSPSLR